MKSKTLEYKAIDFGLFKSITKLTEDQTTNVLVLDYSNQWRKKIRLQMFFSIDYWIIMKIVNNVIFILDKKKNF